MRINKTDDMLSAALKQDDNSMDVDAIDKKAVNEDEFEENDFSRPQATFQFKIENFSRFTKQALSPPCYIRNLPWKILGIARTQERGPIVQKFLGYFLQCNADSESQTWSCQASAIMKIVAQNKEKGNDYCKHISHLFFCKENDWGYNQFMSFKELMDPEKPYYKDDSIILECSVRAEAPHGVMWDSKKHTGYVGLKNQGATCYMNSILQTLFFTNQLRKDVYQIPTEGDDAGKSVALALQRVFYELQTSDKPVGTKKVTKSFGWETLDSFMQHDVQEFCRVLLDKIETKMKGSPVDGRIPKLFEGKMISYIKCKYVDYCSSCTEAFYDIQLNVKDMKNIFESFRQYIMPQTLDGDNKYDAGIHGLQDAEKGVKFVSFPPVLHLQLMRYEYDPTLDTNVKINDRFEFPERLTLDDFLDKPESTPATYILQAVLVHSGDNHGGHYVVYIDPKLDGKWCKFDDDVVSRCTKREAIDANFGGPELDSNNQALAPPLSNVNQPNTNPAPDMNNNNVPTLGAQPNPNLGNRNTSSNAYMLVYIRESAKDFVLKPVTEHDIPDLLVERLREEQRIDIIKRREKKEAHLYYNIDILLDDNFYGFSGHDLFDISNHIKRTFKCRRDSYYKDFLKELANYLKFGVDQIRVWPLFKRSNSTIRFTQVDSLRTHQRLNEFVGGDTWTIWLETIIPDSGVDVLPPFDNTSTFSQVLFFLKFYDPRLRMLYYCGHVYADTNKPFSQLDNIARKRAGLSDTATFLYYEEVDFNRTHPITDLDRPINRVIQELMHGDIIIFQENLGDTVLKQFPFPTPIHYFNDMNSHVDMHFCDKNKPNDPGFKLSLSTIMPYQEAIQYVANYLGVDKNLLQFFSLNPYRDMPQYPIKSTFDGKLDDIFHIKAQSQHRIFYQILSIPLDELENKIQYKCTWVPRYYKEEKELVLYLNKSAATVQDLLIEARKKLLALYGISGGNASPNPRNVHTETLRDSQQALWSNSTSNIHNTNNNNPNTTQFHEAFESINPATQLNLRLVEMQNFKIAAIFKPEAKLDTLAFNTASTQYLISSLSNPQLNSLSSISSTGPLSNLSGNINTPGTGTVIQHNSVILNNLRIEEVPVDQIELSINPSSGNNVQIGNSEETLIPCAHFYRDVISTFGIPFWCKVRNEDTLEDIKGRIRKMLDVPMKEFEKYKFYIVSQGRTNEVSSEWRIILNDLKLVKDVWIGIEHANKQAKMVRSNYMEKPIKILN